MSDPRKKTQSTSANGSSERYEAGAHADAAPGAVDWGLIVDGTEGRSRDVGLFLSAPHVGQLYIAVGLAPDGTPTIASVRQSTSSAVVEDDKAELARLSAALADAAERAANAEAALALARVQSLDSAVPQVAQSLRALQTQLQETQAALADARARLAAAEQSAEQAKHQTVQQRAERERAMSDASRNSQELASARSEVESLRAERDALSTELVRHGKELGEWQARAQTASQKQEEVEAAFAELMDRAEKLQQDLNLALERADRGNLTILGERDSARAQVARLTQELAGVQARLKQAESEQASSKDQLEASAKKIAALESEVRASAANDSAKALAKERDQALADAQEVGVQLDQALAEVAQLRRQLEDSRAALSRTQLERDQSNHQVDILGRQLEAERTARARVTAERDEVRMRMAVPRTRTEPETGGTIEAPPIFEMEAPYGTGGSPGERRESTEPHLVVDAQPAQEAEPGGLDTEWGEETTAPGSRTSDSSKTVATRRLGPQRTRIDTGEDDES